MGVIVGLPTSGGSEKDLRLNFGLTVDDQVEMLAPFLPAEWFLQSGVQLTRPHAGTDWAYMLSEVQECFINIACKITKRELLLIATPYPEAVKNRIAGIVNMNNVRFLECEANDAWTRDHGTITLMGTNGACLLGFTFNGWGKEFETGLDNQITRKTIETGVLKRQYRDCPDSVLEGGSIESDGMGTLLTTSECLLSPHRNASMDRVDIEEHLCRVFHLQRVLWLDHGYLAGDDTDSHIDTLARFCPLDTIAYAKCSDPKDEHYEELYKVEEQLKTFRMASDDPYRLMALPTTDKIEVSRERLPATYANFLILNDSAFYPTYNQPENDELARTVFRETFPAYEVVDIDCRTLIRQHGSLRCVTMQYPMGVTK